MIEAATETPVENPMGEILSADYSLPTKIKLQSSHTSRAYRFYRKIREKLPEWWEEFNTAIDETGNNKYRTVKMFARAKGRTVLEKQWIELMIGREPELQAGERPLVPWLGDWYLRRLNGTWSPEQPEKIRKLARAMQDEKTGWEAIRSVGPYFVQMFAHCLKLQEQLRTAFNGQAIDPSKAPTHPDNIVRWSTYCQMEERVLGLTEQVFNNFMKAHGIDPNKITMQQTQINIQNVGLNAGINVPPLGMAQEGEPRDLSVYDVETVKLAKHLRFMVDNFRMKPPAGLMPPANQINKEREVEMPPSTPSKVNGVKKVQ